MIEKWKRKRKGEESGGEVRGEGKRQVHDKTIAFNLTLETAWTLLYPYENTPPNATTASATEK